MAVVLVLIFVIAAPCFAQTAERYRQRAIEDSRHKSWDEAIANYQKALSLDPNDSLTHYDLALALKYKGDMNAAADEFEKTIQLKPNWAEAHYGLGATQYDLHEFPSALRELQAAVKLDPQNAGMHRFLARVESAQNDFMDAEHELTRSVELKASSDAFMELGVVKGQLGNFDGAAAAFRRALVLNPRSEPAQLMLGIALRRR